MTRDDLSILVVCDEQHNGELVRGLLHNVFANVCLSYAPATHAAELARVAPAVLVLAFSAVATSRDFLQRALATDATLALRPHSCIVLCHRHEVQTAFELCQQHIFDDYVLFWPMTDDGRRLPMVVKQGLRQVELTMAGEETTQRLRVQEQRHETAAQGATPADIQAPRATDQVMRRDEPFCVLFIEDDQEQHAILRLLLGGTEFTPVFASTAARALQMLRTLHPGLMLVDVHLPDGSGVDLIRIIKRDTVFAQTPLITVTGNRTRSIVLGAIAAGAADFIAKPYRRDTLLAKIRQATGMAQARRSATR